MAKRLKDFLTANYSIQLQFGFRENYSTVLALIVGAFLQATSRVPRWWIGERPPDMAASCDIYK